MLLVLWTAVIIQARCIDNILAMEVVNQISKVNYNVMWLGVFERIHVDCHEWCFFFFSVYVGSPLPCPHLRGRGDRNLQDLFRVLECTGIRFVPREPIPFKCTTFDWHFTVSNDSPQKTNVPFSIIQSKLDNAVVSFLDKCKLKLFQGILAH